MSDFLKINNRTHTCNELRIKHINEEVVLAGWVQSVRDHGNMRFINLRDRYGVTQLIVKLKTDAVFNQKILKIRNEWCIGIKGIVENRILNGGSVNSCLATGEIEINIHEIEIFSESLPAPFLIENKINSNEETRLTHRIIDLRRPKMQANFQLRHKVMQIVRNYFDQNNFLELETPILIKHTPGGSRNFIVPSRNKCGSFYALAESPQLFKQMFMMAGFDKYFQIVKCFRDEDLRGDRQPEFTQIDVEMSFINENQIQLISENLIKTIFDKICNIQLKIPFQRITYADSMNRFGTDKPDLRFGLELVNLTEIFRQFRAIDSSILKQVFSEDKIIKAICIPKSLTLSRNDLDNLKKDYAKRHGEDSEIITARIANRASSWKQTYLAKIIPDKYIQMINKQCNASDDDLILINIGKEKTVNATLATLRIYLGKKFNLIPEELWEILWITDFPLFELDDNSGKYISIHHPFTSPRFEDIKYLDEKPSICKARAYDLVINGNEIAGGSIRNHSSEIQSKIFDILGISNDEQKSKFGFFLNALNYGPPPHGGIAFGLDRLCMLLSGSNTIKDVIPFPKSNNGFDLLTGAPSKIDSKYLEELNLYLKDI